MVDRIADHTWGLWSAIQAFFTRILTKRSLYFDSGQVTDSASLETALLDVQSDAQKISTICVRKTDIHTIPQSIAHFQNLTSLDLSYNCIQELPWSIIYLRQLHQLNLSHNEMCSVPHTIGYLVNLRYLNLDCNKLKMLPQCLLKLTSLKTVTVNGNPLISPSQKICSQGTKAILNALGSLNHRRDMWHSWTPNVNGQGLGVRHPPLLTEICLECILTYDVDFLLSAATPPRLKTELLNYQEVQNSRIHVMKCSECRKFFSNRHFFDMHMCK